MSTDQIPAKPGQGGGDVRGLIESIAKALVDMLCGPDDCVRLIAFLQGGYAPTVGVEAHLKSSGI